MDEETAAIKLQCAYRGHLALKKVRNAAKDIYVKETDPESGYSFYLNTQTGVSSWGKPKILGSEDIVGDVSVSYEDNYYEDEQMETKNSVEQPYYDYDNEHQEAADQRWEAPQDWARGPPREGRGEELHPEGGAGGPRHGEEQRVLGSC